MIQACLTAAEVRSLVGFKDKQRVQTENDAFEMIFAAQGESFRRATEKATLELKRMGGPPASSAAHEMAVVGAGTTTTTTATQASGLKPKNGLIIASGNSSFTIAVDMTCSCPWGMFWHTTQKACIKQGGFGYECGFFPEADQHRVCQDGLTCMKVDNVKDNYVSHGIYEAMAGTRPATCKPCTADDKCLTGQERHEADCAKKASISGNACSTVHLKLQPAIENATATANAVQPMVTSEACATEAQKSVDLGFERPLSEGMDVKLMSRVKAKVFMTASSDARVKADKLGGR